MSVWQPMDTAPSVPVEAAWSDEQIIAACNSAGVRWIEPDGEEGGFPGGFDITHMPEMRRLFAALAQQPAAVALSRKYPDDGNGDDDAYNRGWNECLDALATQHQEPTT